MKHFDLPNEPDALESLLLAESGLPGPRANLELAYAAAASLRALSPGRPARRRAEAWKAIPAAATGDDQPAVYLVVVAVMALGPDDEGIIRHAANDPRWRVREAAAMAMQILGEEDPAALRRLVSDWQSSGTTALESRAIVAGLAHYPILRNEVDARFAVESGEEVMRGLHAATGEQRRRDDYKVLRKGLAYALSVFADCCPDEGFALLERWAAVPDKDVAWVIRQNLSKKRIQKPAYAERMAALRARLTDF